MVAVDQGDIRPVERGVFGGGHGGGDGAPFRGQEPAARQPARRLDQVHLTEPRLATLRLLRERILENTRLYLDLPRSPGGPRFAQGDAERADLFAGRLLSDQNLLASRRGGAWPPERIRNALLEGMIQGLAETLEILFELDELNKASWNLVSDVLNVFHRKVESAGF